MDRRTFYRRLLTMAAALSFTPGHLMAGVRRPRVNGERLNGRLRALARFGRNDLGGISRVAYSKGDLEAREYTMDLMRTAGLDVRLDPAGNILGRRPGRDDALPPLTTGSHIDSVPEGGNYDGQVGSMAAIEVAQVLAESGVRLRHPLEVIIFQNEENGKVGSKAIRGEDPAGYLDAMTYSGRTVREGIRYIGGDPDRVAEAAREPGSIAAFLELHIEQGAVLEEEGFDIGVVEGIVGIKRWLVTFHGVANHAGTTPMNRRQDALLAAARFVDAANRVARDTPGRHVATVGWIEAEPGAPNVIPGRATLALEIRDLELSAMDRLFERIRQEGEIIAGQTGTRLEAAQNYQTEPAAASAQVQDVIERNATDLGLRSMRLPSGAGHDAQEMVRLGPTGMIFIPSRGGISHSHEEYSSPEAITAGADVLLRTLITLDAAAPGR